MTGNGKLNHDESLGNPVNAKNRERFSAAEWSDVNAMCRILGGSMPASKDRGTRYGRSFVVLGMVGWKKVKHSVL